MCKMRPLEVGDGDGSGMCGQSIMKERPLQKVEAGCGVPPLRRRQGVSGVPGAREPQEDIGKSTEGCTLPWGKDKR